MAFAEGTDFLVLQGDCFLALADVVDSAEPVEQALERYERKGASALAEKARALSPRS